MVVERFSFVPVFVAAGVMYPIGFLVILLTIRGRAAPSRPVHRFLDEGISLLKLIHCRGQRCHRKLEPSASPGENREPPTSACSAWAITSYWSQFDGLLDELKEQAGRARQTSRGDAECA